MLIFDQLKRNDRPLWMLSVLALCAMGLLLSGLWYLQIIASKRYVETQKNQAFRRVRYPALRGSILDRNGQALAENRPSHNINLYLEELSPQFQEVYSRLRGKQKLSRDQIDTLIWKSRYLVVSNVVFQVGQLLQEPLLLNEERFIEHYANRLVLPLPILEDLTPRQMALFQETPNKIPGLGLDIQPLRTYTNGTVASHLLGHLQRVEKFASDDDSEMDSVYCLPGLPDYEGRVGVEAAYEEELSGKAGIKSVLINHKGYRQAETILSPAIPGNNVVLTIDVRIQKAAEQALRTITSTQKGAVVVMDPRTGDILALVSAPWFDPNQFIPRMSSANWKHLSDPELKPMLNRATFAAYTPGSIFKVIVGLACLEMGDLDPKAIYHSKGYYQLGRKSFGDTAPAGEYDFKRAFKLSSNSYFIEHGLKTGLPAIMDMGHRFFLGKSTQLPLRQEVSGFFPSSDWVRKRTDQGEPVTPGDLANLSIGQGYITVTPVQMAVMIAAVANGGKVLWPRIIDRIEPRVNDGVTPVRRFVAGRVRGDLGVRAHTLQLVRDSMLADVEDSDGTGRHAAVPGFRICGKTGTAQVTHGSKVVRKDTWFVSYAPYESPRYVVVVVAEGGGSGGGTCAPVAQKIYQAIKKVEDQSAVQGGLAINN